MDAEAGSRAWKDLSSEAQIGDNGPMESHICFICAIWLVSSWPDRVSHYGTSYHHDTRSEVHLGKTVPSSVLGLDEEPQQVGLRPEEDEACIMCST